MEDKTQYFGEDYKVSKLVTVKDFKDAGLLVVIGDQVLDTKAGASYTIDDGFRLSVLTAVGSDADDCTEITEFAWRTNTGVKPEFKGGIESISNDGHGLQHSTVDELCWLSNIKFKWRPLITKEQTEEHAPVYTQAMADDGELPENGAKCQGYVLAETKNQGKPCDKWIEGVFIQKSQSPNGGMCFLFKCDSGHYYTLGSVSHFKPIDTKTDKEKLRESVIEHLVINNKHTYSAAKSSVDGILNKFTITPNK